MGEHLKDPFKNESFCEQQNFGPVDAVFGGWRLFKTFFWSEMFIWSSNGGVPIIFSKFRDSPNFALHTEIKKTLVVVVAALVMAALVMVALLMAVVVVAAVVVGWQWWLR